MAPRSDVPSIPPPFSSYIAHEAAKVTSKDGGIRRALELLDLVANIAIEKPERVPAVRTAMDIMLQRLDAESKPGFRKPKAKETVGRAQRALAYQMEALGKLIAPSKPAETGFDNGGFTGAAGLGAPTEPPCISESQLAAATQA